MSISQIGSWPVRTATGSAVMTVPAAPQAFDILFAVGTTVYNSSVGSGVMNITDSIGDGAAWTAIGGGIFQMDDNPIVKGRQEIWWKRVGPSPNGNPAATVTISCASTSVFATFGLYRISDAAIPTPVGRLYSAEAYGFKTHQAFYSAPIPVVADCITVMSSIIALNVDAITVPPDGFSFASSVGDGINYLYTYVKVNNQNQSLTPVIEWTTDTWWGATFPTLTFVPAPGVTLGPWFNYLANQHAFYAP